MGEIPGEPGQPFSRFHVRLSMGFAQADRPTAGGQLCPILPLKGGWLASACCPVTSRADEFVLKVGTISLKLGPRRLMRALLQWSCADTDRRGGAAPNSPATPTINRTREAAEQSARPRP